MLNNYIPAEILEKMFLGNSIEQYIISLIYFIVAMIILGILQKVILAKLDILSKKTKNDIDDVAVKIVKGIKPRFYMIMSLYIAVQVLTLHDIVLKIVNAIFILIIVFQVAKSLQTLIHYITRKFNGEEEAENIQEVLRIF